jgi:hypothetical protein
MKKDENPAEQDGRTSQGDPNDGATPEAFSEDLAVLVQALRESFESERARYFVDEIHEVLYIEIEGLEEYSPEEITEIASPLLEELDLDFEEISLVPLSA